MSVVFLSGPITGDKNYYSRFKQYERILVRNGYTVLNPAILPNSDELSHDDYMKITLAMLEVSDIVLMLRGWEQSKGAVIEESRARDLDKKIIYEKTEFLPLLKPLVGNYD